MHKRVFEDYVPAVPRITFHVIALFIWLVYLHQPLDLIGSSRLVICASFICIQLENPLKIIPTATTVSWRKLAWDQLQHMMSKHRTWLHRSLYSINLSLAPRRSTFRYLSLSSDLKVTLCSHIVSLALVFLLCRAALFVFQSRWEDRATTERLPCVFASVCGGPDGPAISFESFGWRARFDLFDFLCPLSPISPHPFPPLGPDESSTVCTVLLDHGKKMYEMFKPI